MPCASTAEGASTSAKANGTASWQARSQSSGGLARHAQAYRPPRSCTSAVALQHTYCGQQEKTHPLHGRGRCAWTMPVGADAIDSGCVLTTLIEAHMRLPLFGLATAALVSLAASAQTAKSDQALSPVEQ